MAEDNRNKDFLTTSQAARLLCVSPDTVLKWVKAGKVKSYRTLGGHFRIPIAELNIPPSNAAGQQFKAPAAQVHQYCWEYLSGGGDINTECKECVTYRSRARRCYELKNLPDGLGCLNLLCDTECSQCDYYKVVVGQGLNIIIVSENKKLLSDFDATGDVNGIHVRFAADEYETAVEIQNFRPDFIVVDCAFGKKRTTSICANLFSDIRLPIVRVILSSKTRQSRDYCDNEVFGWIKKPFSIDQLKECIQGIPKSADQNVNQPER